ncbi:DUF4278 domain-containing protein [Trichothermofontia sp.]
MKLTYRGVSYEPAPSTLPVVEEPVGGIYRGAVWRRHRPQQEPALQPPVQLTYRGVPYAAHLFHAPAAVAVAEPTAATVTQPEMPQDILAQQAAVAAFHFPRKSKRKLLSETWQRHRQNVRLSTEHRLEVARQKGDTRLVQMLEQELDQLAY